MPTLVELTALTKAQLIDKMLEGVTETTSVLTKREDGENVLLEETTKDAYGKVVGSRVVAWTYYKTGEVNEIGVVQMDALGKAVETYNVKHYLDGRQPEMLLLEDKGEAELVLGTPVK